MDKEGKIYVLEANLNPYLANGDIMAMAAQSSGISYKQLVEGIVRSALARGKVRV
jgi:D-alanine-D-alanine ligase-like ATP-grasp enzyme